MSDHHVVPRPAHHDAVEILLITHPGRRVVGIPQNEQLELIPELGADSRQIRTPVLFCGERQGLGPSSRKMQPTRMGGITGVQMQGSITCIEHRQRQMGGSFLGSHEELNLVIGIHRNVKAMATPVRHGGMERPQAGLKAIGATAGIHDRCGHGVQQRLGRPKIGGSDGEIHQIWTRRRGGLDPIGLLGSINAGKDGVAQRRKPFRGWHPGRTGAAVWR